MPPGLGALPPIRSASQSHRRPICPDSLPKFFPAIFQANSSTIPFSRDYALEAQTRVNYLDFRLRGVARRPERPATARGFSSFGGSEIPRRLRCTSKGSDIPRRIRIPARPVQQMLHRVSRRFPHPLGQLPAVLPLTVAQQPCRYARLRARGSERANNPAIRSCARNNSRFHPARRFSIADAGESTPSRASLDYQISTTVVLEH
jgi:hypothetical protein